MTAADRFWSQLQALYGAADKPTLDALVRLGLAQRPSIKISDSTINGWLNRKAVPTGAKNQRYVLAMVDFLQARVRANSGYKPLPIGEWVTLLREAQIERAAGKRKGRPRRADGLLLTDPQRGSVTAVPELDHSALAEQALDASWIEASATNAGPTARSAYLEQVRRIAPTCLRDRGNELAKMATFCIESGDMPFMWWQASAWSGKTALMAWFVLHPPPDVTIVPFFITARYAGQNDRIAFVDVVMEQLAEMLGQPMPAYLTAATREPHLLGMLNEAARQLHARGKRLVLLVDGLDEDRGVTIGPDAYSITALLPARPAPGLRIIVSGRPDPPIPADVPDDHPLRDSLVVSPLANPLLPMW